MYKKLLEKIKEFDNISIFRHERPDGDCAFSSYAFAQFIKDNFDDKKVKLCGEDEYDLLPINDKVTNKFISESLAIVLDTASVDRIDDGRFITSQYLIKIDHHPANDNFGDFNIVDSGASSTSQILAEIFFSKEFSDYEISNKVCNYLYSGIVTDTINFRTSNTTSKTLLYASKLIEQGDLKVSGIVESLMDLDIETYSKVTKLRESLVIDKQFGYIKLDKKTLNNIGFTPVEAKNQINEIGHISDLNIWALAVENGDGWDCSLRSKRPYIINKIAQKYGGGGHNNASAVKQISSQNLTFLLEELADLSTKK